MSNLSISNSSMLAASSAASSVQSQEPSSQLTPLASETVLNTAQQELFKMVLHSNNFFVESKEGIIDLNWEGISRRMEIFNCTMSPAYLSMFYYKVALDVLRKFNPLNGFGLKEMKVEDACRLKEQEMIKLIVRNYYTSLLVYNRSRQIYELDSHSISKRMALLGYQKSARSISLLFHETIKNLLPTFNPIQENTERKLTPMPEFSAPSLVTKAIGPSATFASSSLLLNSSAPIPLTAPEARKGDLINISAASYESPSVSGIKRKYSESSVSDSAKNTQDAEAHVCPGYFEEANKLLLKALEAPAIKNINNYDYSMDLSELREYSEAVKEAFFIRTQLYNPKTQRTAFAIEEEEKTKVLKIIDDNFHLEPKAMLDLLKSHGYNWTICELDDFFNSLVSYSYHKYGKYCPRIHISQCSPAALIKMLLMHSQAIAEARIKGISTLDLAMNPPRLRNIATEISKELNLTAHSSYLAIRELRNIKDNTRAAGKKVSLIASGLGISLLPFPQTSELNEKLSRRGPSVPVDKSAEDASLTSLAVETLFELASGSNKKAFVASGEQLTSLPTSYSEEVGSCADAGVGDQEVIEEDL